MITKDVTLINKLGLHIRPAAQFTKIASQYAASVFLSKDGIRINAKSIMGVMMLAANRGAVLKIECDGPDEQELMDKLVELIENKFYED
ncbi:HPr family phosphocarrier protein [bacterium]|nr:HPr family phosphocarrier protein [bacterium]MBU1636710.1 HPr family phosphocarrier protein [bacterium]MBU1920025.1 HPr family phosphocarrier protein [bacterium]RQV96891.1 MAG: HPr family phosphocarrier protein [bacterium]